MRDETTQQLGDGEVKESDYTFTQMRDLLFEVAKKMEEVYPWYMERQAHQLQGPLDQVTRDLIRRA
jgi:hypothetical protein